ncbi:MAG: 16S rRNA (uracil(1498)-N(3))-methyltransferase [Elusimicrobiales bacterium]|nr:16S rRNA (uracil(1498)-N(3))-methyltransferase [Elusimicrobiales bacterium]
MQFICPPITSSCSQIMLDEEESFHAVKVLRLRKGDLIKIFDGNSRYLAKIKDILDGKVIVSDFKKLPSYKKKYIINLYLPFIDKKDFEDIVRCATELGVDNFIPVITRYTQGNFVPKNFDFYRLKKIIISSVKQCERSSIPDILEPISFNDILSLNKKFIVGWTSKIKNISFYDVVKIMSNEVNILVGPEGGFSDNEKDYIEKNFLCFNICNNILTTKTAVIAILGCVNHFFENENLF